MRFYKVREEILKGNNIAELPLRVTYYDSLSTDDSNTNHRLDNQISFFEYLTLCRFLNISLALILWYLLFEN